MKVEKAIISLIKHLKYLNDSYMKTHVKNIKFWLFSDPASAVNLLKPLKILFRLVANPCYARNVSGWSLIASVLNVSGGRHSPGSTEAITFSSESESWLLIRSVSIIDLHPPGSTEVIAVMTSSVRKRHTRHLAFLLYSTPVSCNVWANKCHVVPSSRCPSIISWWQATKDMLNLHLNEDWMP